MIRAFTHEELAAAGKAAFDRGEFAEAAKEFQAAAEGCRLSGDTLTAAEMDNNCSVCLLQLGDAGGALKAVQGTPELFAEGGDPRRQALACGNQAAALQALGRLDEAETAYLKSADLLGQLGEDQLRATVLRSVSELQLRSGRPLEAVNSFQDGLSGIKKPRPQQRLIKKILQMPTRFLG